MEISGELVNEHYNYILVHYLLFIITIVDPWM